MSTQNTERILVVKQLSVTENVLPAPPTFTIEHRDLVFESWYYVERQVGQVNKFGLFVLYVFWPPIAEKFCLTFLYIRILNFALGRINCIYGLIQSITRIEDDVSISATLWYWKWPVLWSCIKAFASGLRSGRRAG